MLYIMLLILPKTLLVSYLNVNEWESSLKCPAEPSLTVTPHAFKYALYSQSSCSSGRRCEICRLALGRWLCGWNALLLTLRVTDSSEKRVWLLLSWASALPRKGDSYPRIQALTANREDAFWSRSFHTSSAFGYVCFVVSYSGCFRSNVW